MIIVTPKGQVDTEEESVILVFNDDNELNSFLSSLAKTPVLTSGARVFPMICIKKPLTSIQEVALEVLGALDGVGGNNHGSIIDDAISIIDKALDE